MEDQRAIFAASTARDGFFPLLAAEFCELGFDRPPLIENFACECRFYAVAKVALCRRVRGDYHP